MSNPRIEEVDEASDPEEMDVDAFDFARPSQGGLSTSQVNLGQQASIQAQQRFPEKERLQREREAHERSKSYQCIYPVYFDSTRSREEGRRVRKQDAVPNPLAREMADACAHIGNTLNVPLQIVFEPQKTHPKDWGNPGRVRVLVKREGKAVSAKIANKHHLYKLIADYLKVHPTTEDSAMRYRFAGMPPPREKPQPPAIPRGYKIGTILPLHSPALSGGGVSDNMFKDLMDGVGGQLPAGMEGMQGIANMAAMGGAGGSGGQQQQPKKVKDKKKK